MTKPKILFATDAAMVGGAEAVMFEQVRVLVEEGVEVHVYSAGETAQRDEFVARLPTGVAFHSGRRTAPIFAEEMARRALGALTKSSSQLNGHGSLVASLRQVQRRVGATAWYVPKLLPFIAEVARSLRVPYVVHSHATPPSLRNLPADLVRDVLRDARARVAAASVARDYVTAVAEAPCHLLYDGADVTRYALAANSTSRAELRRSLGIGERDFVWYMSGRFEYAKGCDLVDQVMRNSDGAHFVWLGAPGNCAHATYVAKRYAATKNIHVLGRQTDRYWDWIHACDGMAFVSREDCFPLVAIEAMAAQKPIVTFANGGIVEMLSDGKYASLGVVIDDWSTARMANAMQQIAAGELTFDRQALAARGQSFSFERLRRDWSALWRESIAPVLS